MGGNDREHFDIVDYKRTVSTIGKLVEVKNILYDALDRANDSSTDAVKMLQEGSVNLSNSVKDKNTVNIWQVQSVNISFMSGKISQALRKLDELERSAFEYCIYTVQDERRKIDNEERVRISEST